MVLSISIKLCIFSIRFVIIEKFLKLYSVLMFFFNDIFYFYYYYVLMVFFNDIFYSQVLRLADVNLYLDALTKLVLSIIPCVKSIYLNTNEK
jgi:hypothetical protein